MILFETTNEFSWPGQNIHAVHRAVKSTDADVQAQSERLHNHLNMAGYTFPKITHANHDSDPVIYWTGSGSKKITALALDLHKGMPRQEAAAKHGSNVMEMHDRLMGEIGKAPSLPENVHVFASVSHQHGEILNAVKEKGIYNNPAPLSVSLHPAIAYKRGLAGHVANIFMHEGSAPGLYIGGSENHAFSHHGNNTAAEYEMIVKPKRKLLLVGRQRSVMPTGTPLTVHNFVDVTDK